MNPTLDQGPGLPTPDFSVEADAAPFWEAAAHGRLHLPRCRRCQTFVWYPRAHCPSCGGHKLRWIDLAGTGVVYSFSIPRRGQGAYADAAPYVVAYVALDVPDGRHGPVAGPRVITNIVGCAPEAVRVDLPVQAVFDPAPSGHALIRFRPVEPA